MPAPWLEGQYVQYVIAQAEVREMQRDLAQRKRSTAAPRKPAHRRPARLPPLGAKDGPLLPEYTVKYGAVSLIFMISGLSLRTQQLSAAVRNVPLHAFVQGFTLLFIPLLFYVLVVPGLTAVGLDVWLARGLMVVGCMPPPVSSAVILTKASARRPTPDSYTPENARERFARVGARLTRAPLPPPPTRAMPGGRGQRGRGNIQLGVWLVLGVFVTPVLLLLSVDVARAAPAST